MENLKISEIIIKLRKEKNLTQKEFADILKVTPQAVSKWENARGIPDIEILILISKEFNVDFNKLINDKKNKFKKYYLLLLLIPLFFILYYFNEKDTYHFREIKSKNSSFTVSGVAAYSKEKKSIYISSIEYLDNNKKFISIDCSLYEKINNDSKFISNYKSGVKRPASLTEFLKEMSIKIENYKTDCTIPNNLYLEINAKDINNEISIYKIPLVLDEQCD